MNADAKLQFAIEYDQAQDRLYAVSRASANKASKTAMLVTCDTIRFEPNSIVFTNAELESPGQKIKADAATVRLDRVTGSNVSWHFSENATISMSGKDAAESFLKESSRD
ncbi:hypothetical protein [Rhodopirellula sp. MGV]|uniref:hypothetical protein n=1 Tax=Rhodopirellula sp. MGV TaxID=2023130 RepID=UPI00117A90E5|nr:hypothetical protein [Rhodopirellula sp. MGV]